MSEYDINLSLSSLPHLPLSQNTIASPHSELARDVMAVTQAHPVTQPASLDLLQSAMLSTFDYPHAVTPHYPTPPPALSATINVVSLTAPETPASCLQWLSGPQHAVLTDVMPLPVSITQPLLLPQAPRPQPAATSPLQPAIASRPKSNRRPRSQAISNNDLQQMRQRIAAEPQLGKRENESNIDWALRLKAAIPTATPQLLLKITNASASNLAERAAFNTQALSASAQQIQKKLEEARLDPDIAPHKIAAGIKKKKPHISRQELIRITGANPGSLANEAIFRQTPLSANGIKLQQILVNEPLVLRINRPKDKITALLQAAQKHNLSLSDTDICILTDIPRSVVSKYSVFNQAKPGLNARKIMALINSDAPGGYARTEGQTPYQWAQSILTEAQRTLPTWTDLTVRDLMLITGAPSYHTMQQTLREQKKPLSASGERLQRWLNAADWNPYKQLPMENEPDWAERLANMDNNLAVSDLVKLTGCNVNSVKTRIDKRMVLSTAGEKIRDAVNAQTPEDYAFQPGETWIGWYHRLRQASHLSDGELSYITGFILPPDSHASYERD